MPAPIPLDPADRENPAVIARLALLLQNIDVGDILAEGFLLNIDRDEDANVRYTLTAQITRTIYHGDLLAVTVPYPLLSIPNRVAAAPEGIRAEYRRQYDEFMSSSTTVGLRVPVHPDVVDERAAARTESL